MRLIYSFFAIEFLAFVFVALAPESFFEGQTLLAMAGWLSQMMPPSAKVNVEFLRSHSGIVDAARYVILYWHDLVRFFLIGSIATKWLFQSFGFGLLFFLWSMYLLSRTERYFDVMELHVNTLLLDSHFFFLAKFLSNYVFLTAFFYWIYDECNKQSEHGRV
jgi:hypothetical protein